MKINLFKGYSAEAIDTYMGLFLDESAKLSDHLDDLEKNPASNEHAITLQKELLDMNILIGTELVTSAMWYNKDWTPKDD